MTKLLVKLGLSVLVLKAGLGAELAAQEKSWSIEVGTQVGYHENYFFRGEGAPAPTTRLVSVYSLGQKEFRTPLGRYALFYNVSATRARDIDDTNRLSALTGLRFRAGGNRLTAQAYYDPDRIYDEEDDGIVFDVMGTAFEYRRDLVRGLWVGAGYATHVSRFAPELSSRDSRTDELSGSLRIPLSGWAGVRGTVYYGAREAEDPNQNHISRGIGGTLELQPHDRFGIYIRYRVREREYGDSGPLDSNFGREDQIRDVVSSLRWEAGKHWGFNIGHYYREGNSTRSSRNHFGHRLLGGIFILF